MTLTGLLILSSGFFLMTVATAQAVAPRVRSLFYGWKLVGLTMVSNALASLIWSGVGVWIKALEIQFGWSRTQLTGAFVLTQLEGSIIGPVMGYLIDRLGPQRMVFFGITVVGLGYIVFSRTTNLPMFYLAYFIIITGASAGFWLPFMTTINRWFNRKRSTAMAIAGEGNPLGSVLLIPLVAWAVTPGHLGWSTTALWIGIFFLAIAWPISKGIRTQPEDYGQYADGDPLSNLKEEQTSGDDTSDRNTLEIDQPDFTARQAMRTSAFWFITFGQALSSMLIGVLTVHLVPLLTDQGLSLQTASFMLSVMMGVWAVFQLVGGYLGDRFPKNLVLFGFTTLQAVGFTLVAFVHTLPMAILAMVIFGAGGVDRHPRRTDQALPNGHRLGGPRYRRQGFPGNRQGAEGDRARYHRAHPSGRTQADRRRGRFHPGIHVHSPTETGYNDSRMNSSEHEEADRAWGFQDYPSPKQGRTLTVIDEKPRSPTTISLLIML